MNYVYKIAQPCFRRFKRGQETQFIPNLRKRFVLFDEIVAEREVTARDSDLHWLYEECVLYTKFKDPIGPFTCVYKAVYDLESWKSYGYFLVGEVDIERVYRAIRAGYVWPFSDMIAFSENMAKDSENLVTYSDDFVITGVNKPRRCRLLPRRD